MDVKKVIETQIERLQKLQTSDPYWAVDTAREIRKYIELIEALGLRGYNSSFSDCSEDTSSL